ncbi:MAG: hypothetical protein NZ522_06720 [Chitinophagales bacterium]|nr:hypothetical protein [Chitinophagales bacterium]
MLLFWIATFAIYFKAHPGSLVDDGHAAIVDFKTMGWRGFLNNYGMSSLYHVHDFINNIWYCLFGLNTKAWFALTASLHAINAWLLFCFIFYWLKKLSAKYFFEISVSGAALFLLSPYQSENIIWAATHHYGFAMLFFWILAFLTLNLNQENYKKNAFITYLIFSLSLLTREETLVYPGVLVTLFIVQKITQKSNLETKKYFTHFVLPFLLLIVLYFILTRIAKGHWIPHYGTTHIENISLRRWVSVFLQYCAKNLFLIHFFNLPIRESIYIEIIEKHVWKLTVIVVLVLVIIMRFFLRNNRQKLIFGFLSFSVLILTLPVLNLYFMYIFPYENDRMSYFFGLFFFPLVAYMLFTIFKRFALTIILPALVLFLVLDNRKALCWQQAGSFFFNCVNSLPDQPQGRMFFLSIPLKYQGVYAFRSINRIENAIMLADKKVSKHQLIGIAWAEFSHPSDNVLVEKINESEYAVALQLKKGSWLMQNEMGATDRETKDYIFNITDANCCYRLKIKQKLPDDSFWIIKNGKFAPLGL